MWLSEMLINLKDAPGSSRMIVFIFKKPLLFEKRALYTSSSSLILCFILYYAYNIIITIRIFSYLSNAVSAFRSTVKNYPYRTFTYTFRLLKHCWRWDILISVKIIQ